MEIKANGKITLGVIIGNRDFFPGKLVGECRTHLLEAFENPVPQILLELAGRTAF